MYSANFINSNKKMKVLVRIEYMFCYVIICAMFNLYWPNFILYLQEQVSQYLMSLCLHPFYTVSDVGC